MWSKVASSDIHYDRYHPFGVRGEPIISVGYFDRGETTDVTLSVAGASGLGATCSFTVSVTGRVGMEFSQHCNFRWCLMIFFIL